MSLPSQTLAASTTPRKTALAVLIAISAGHGVNDLLQAVIPTSYPTLQEEFGLSFAQIGLIQLVFQLTASVLQPAVGLYTDRTPQPFSLPVGMLFTLSGILLLAFASSYGLILIAVSLVGVGSSVFHPEASRIARLSSGGRHGMAQSLFQVGGNIGSAIGPLLAALILAARGQQGLAWFSLIALGGVALLGRVSFWYRHHERRPQPSAVIGQAVNPPPLVQRAVVILSLLMFSKFFYMSAMTSFYTFFLIGKFDVSVQESQLMLFVFLASVAIGTIAGGPIGDRFGRKPVLWASIIGALPFTLALPHLGYSATIASSIFIGLTLSSAFPAIVVYAQELVPGKVGVISGIFFGLAFGLGGIGAAVLGWLADITSIEFVFNVCGVLPAIGGLIWFLPSTSPPRSKAVSATDPRRAV